MADKRGVFSMIGDVTAAQSLLYRQAAGASPRGSRTRRRRKSKSGARTTRRRARRSSGGTRTRTKRTGRSKLVKGSAAAKRYMARLRRMRKK